MATITSGSRTGGGKTFTVGDTVYFTNYSTTLNGSAGSNSGYTMPWHGKISKLYDTTYTNWVYTTNNTDAAGKTSAYTMLVRPSWCTKGYKVTVTYNKNGGSSGTASQTGYVGASLTGTATRAGYHLTGWYTAASGGTKKTTIPSSAATYYAHWTANTYTVKYNANGGSGTMANGNSSYTTWNYGTSYTLRPNSFTKSGSTFSGWATSASGAKVYNNSASVKNLTTTNGGTVTLYAVWVTNPCTITFKANGGVGADYTQQVSQGVASLLTLNQFTRPGYIFSGWATSADGTVQHKNGREITASTSTLTLYAKWEPNRYRIIYLKDSYKTEGSMALQRIFYDNSKKLLKNHFTKKGYTFSHWIEGQPQEKMISEECDGSTITLDYYLQENEYYYKGGALDFLTGVIEDGVLNPSAFTVISGPTYNPVSRKISVTGYGTSSATLKYCYLKFNYYLTLYQKTLSFDIIIDDDTYLTLPTTLTFDLYYNNQYIQTVTKEDPHWFIYESNNSYNVTTINISVDLNYTNLNLFTVTNSNIEIEWCDWVSLDYDPQNSNIYTDLLVVSNLRSENLDSVILYPVWEEDSNYNPFMDQHLSLIKKYDNIIYYLGSNIYPVGSLYVSSEKETIDGVVTAVNPAKRFGGKWELMKKDFIPKVFNNEHITFDSTNTSSGASWIIRYPKVAHADTALVIATIDWPSLGYETVYQIREIVVNDGYNFCAMGSLYETLNIVDVIGADTTTSFGPGTSGLCQVRFSTMSLHSYMLDKDCDRFYWYRYE